MTIAIVAISATEVNLAKVQGVRHLFVVDVQSALPSGGLWLRAEQGAYLHLVRLSAKALCTDVHIGTVSAARMLDSVWTFCYSSAVLENRSALAWRYMATPNNSCLILLRGQTASPKAYVARAPNILLAPSIPSGIEPSKLQAKPQCSDRNA